MSIIPRIFQLSCSQPLLKQHSVLRLLRLDKTKSYFVLNYRAEPFYLFWEKLPSVTRFRRMIPPSLLLSDITFFQKKIRQALRFCRLWKNSENWIMEPIELHWLMLKLKYNPTGIYLFKVSNGKTRKMCEICSSKLTSQYSSYAFCAVNFEHISHIVLGFSLLNMNK